MTEQYKDPLAAASVDEIPSPKSEEETEKENLEAKIESMMTPLRELLDVEVFKGQNWFVSMEYKEPQFTEDGSIREWKLRTGYGRLNVSFLQRAEEIYRYWIPKAHIHVRVTKVEWKGSSVEYQNLNW